MKYLARSYNIRKHLSIMCHMVEKFDIVRFDEFMVSSKNINSIYTRDILDAISIYATFI